MKPLSILTDEQLKFHAADAEQAVKANPRNNKALQYLQELHACESELQRREMLRSCRARARDLFDPLAYRERKSQEGKFVNVEGFRIPAWHRDSVRTAAHRVAYLKISRHPKNTITLCR